MHHTSLATRAAFFQKTRDAYENHLRRSRAAEVTLSYGLEELRDVVALYLTRGECSYCRGDLTVKSFVITHKTPPERGGRYSLRNIAVCCRECHVLKGSLDEHEFRDLLRLMSQWPKALNLLFRARLRAGASLVRTALPLPSPTEDSTDPTAPTATAFEF